MNERKTGTAAVLIALGAAVIFVILMLAVNTGRSLPKEDPAGELASSIAGTDSMLYAVGTPLPGMEMLGENVTLAPAGQISEDNMPVWWSSFHQRTYDQQGNLISETVPREYPEHMLIVVNLPGGTELSSGEWEILRNCSVENDVPMLLIGADTVNRFREVLLLPPWESIPGDTALFSADTGWIQGPVDLDGVTDDNEAAVRILEYWNGEITDGDRQDQD